MNESARPVTVLIAAMGGEGGAVLMNWIVTAAAAQGLTVQSTSVPGVAQRTGATTYYIELFAPDSASAGRRPVLSLYPGIGDIDLLVASELIEVGRAMERGFVSPERTTLVGCTHRFYSVVEKMHGTDGRFDGERVLEAAPQLAQRAVLFDGQAVARESGCVVNAVLLGAIAGTGRLPLPVAALEQAIRATGKAVESNLAGFAAGLEYGRGEMVERPEPERLVTAGVERDRGSVDAMLLRAQSEFPAPTHDTLQEAIKRLVQYQDDDYARLYLDRLAAVAAVDADVAGAAELTNETGRQLAVWMSYEDVIRVAQLKTQHDRVERVRKEAGAAPGQIVKVTEFLKPGIEEFCSVLPPFLARPILRWASRNGRMERLAFAVQLRSTTISGFVRLWLMAKLRPLRRRGYRYGQEQAMIETWLDLVRRAAVLDTAVALEIAGCARLVRGYGETHARGVVHFRRIAAEIIEPILAGDDTTDTGAHAIRAAREAALADPDAGPRPTPLTLPVLTPGSGPR